MQRDGRRKPGAVTSAFPVPASSITDLVSTATILRTSTLLNPDSASGSMQKLTMCLVFPWQTRGAIKGTHLLPIPIVFTHSSPNSVDG